MLTVTRTFILVTIVAGIIFLLYLLKERFKRVTVSNIFLWNRVLSQKSATSIIKKFRRFFSYLLNLTIVICLAASITERCGSKNRERRTLVIIMDTSASMASIDEKPSRLKVAVDSAIRLLDTLRENDKALIIEATSPVKVIHPWSHDFGSMKKSLEKLKINFNPGRIFPAMEMGLAALKSADGEKKEIWIFSDGAIEKEKHKEEASLKIFEEIKKHGIKINHFRVGKKKGNIAITSFSARQNLKEKLKLSGSLTLKIFPAAEKKYDCRKIGIKVKNSSAILFTKEINSVDIERMITFDILTPSERVLKAVIEPDKALCGENFLLIDDSATLILPEKLQLKILAITGGNPYLMAALLLSPLWDVEITNSSLKPRKDFYDVVIVDRLPLESDINSAGILYIKPPSEGSPLKVRGEAQVKMFEKYDYNHPALKWTNLYNVNIANASIYEVRKEDKVLASGSSVPLIIELQKEKGRRGIILAYSLDETDMTLRTTWPLMFINMVYYLSGESMEVTSASNSPEESDIAPAWIPYSTTISAIPRAPHKIPVRTILIILAMLLLLFEWVAFHKRWTV